MTLKSPDAATQEPPASATEISRAPPICVLVTPEREPALLADLEEAHARRQADILAETEQQRQEMLLLEVHHRIANSLQLIASILMMQLRTVHSEESRALLLDMHRRLISVATVQTQLCAPGLTDGIAFRPYLARLCENLEISMTAQDHPITVRATSTDGTIKSDKAVSFGLIITELVINSLKHAFPGGRKGVICVDFAMTGADWRLCVSDDGVGRPAGTPAPDRGGLGTRIIASVAQHLKAGVEIVSGGLGTATILTHTAQAD